MWQRFLVRKNERALLLKEGDFERILQPGVYQFFKWGNPYSVQTFSLNQALFDSGLVDYLMRSESELVKQNFNVLEINDQEAALRYEQGNLVEVLMPGTRQLYWRDAKPQTFERIDLTTTWQLNDSLVARLTQQSLRKQQVLNLNAILMVQVPDAHLGLLRLDGKLVQLLEPGRYGFWRFNRDIQVELVDTRLQALEVNGQEILTRDKVSLRVNLNANWRFDDVALAFAKLPKPAEYLYRELQLGLRAAVGTRTLDELLENKQTIDVVVREYMQGKLAGFGLNLQSIGVKDIVLPGEMKTLLAQVVEAEKAAQANAIRRREETGATRSLLNTAKVMEDNPTALRLKELETLERLAERIDRISVFGGLDQLLNGLVKIAR
jgi:regulator of protease activity HflC (stomatin/prohibitin superfamily)